jgi:hypothetical protein
MKQATRNVRHKSRVALLLVDVINHFEFPDGKNILYRALAIAPSLARHSRCSPRSAGHLHRRSIRRSRSRHGRTSHRQYSNVKASRLRHSRRVRTRLHPCSSVNRLNRAGP